MHTNSMQIIGASVSEPRTNELNGGISFIYMWQSHVEVEGYSIAYFDCIAVFDLLYR